MPSFTATVDVTPHYKNCNQKGYIELATSDPLSHLNVYLRREDGNGAKMQALCMMPQDGIALRDALLKAYPIEKSRFVVDPVKPNPLKPGDAVRYNTIVGYGIQGLYNGAKGVVMAVDTDTSVIVRITDSFPMRNVRIGVQYLTKVEEAAKPGTYIVALSEGGPKPSAKPVVHSTRAAAEGEAERLAEKHGGDFVVYHAVTMKRRPKVVTPPVTSIKLD